MLNKFNIVMYSHSSYSDLWDAFIGETNLYLNPNKIIKFLDIEFDKDTIIYNKELEYTERLKSCLTKLDSEIILFCHEDFILYDYADIDELNKYCELIQSSEFDFIRLLKCGELRDIPSNYPNLYLLPKDSHHIFAVQATLWKVDKFLELLNNISPTSIWNMESIAQNTCRQLNLKSAYAYHGGKKRGETHFDSTVFPYIATAVFKGKWLKSEYSFELNNIFKKYDISVDIRGHI